MLNAQNQAPEQNTTFTPTQVQWNAIFENARRLMSRPADQIVNGTAVGLTKNELVGTWGMRADGPWVSAIDPDAVVVVDTYNITVSGFENGLSLNSTNAIMDRTHNCIFFYHVDHAIAHFIVP